MDSRQLREAMTGDDGAGVIDKMNETISNQYKLLKQKLKLPDNGSDEGSVEGSGLVKDPMRRALQFMSLSRSGGAGSDGTGSDAAQPRNDASSDGNSHRGGGGGSRSGGGGRAGSKVAGRNGKGSSEHAGAGMDAATLHKLKKKQVLSCVRLVCFWWCVRRGHHTDALCSTAHAHAHTSSRICRRPRTW